MVGAKFPIQVDLKFSRIFIVGNEGMGFPWWVEIVNQLVLHFNQYKI
jgi:hypothetical protein